MRRAIAALILSAASAAAPLRAQVTAALEAGGSRLSYDGSADVSAVSLAPSLEWLSPSSRVTAEGGFAQLTGGGWSLQGAAALSAFTPPLGAVRGEMVLEAAGSTRDAGSGAGDVRGHARLHWLGAREGVWVGAALGRGWNGTVWAADRRADAGAWLRRGEATASVTATPTWLGDSLRFVDAELAGTVSHGVLDVAATGGFRQWSRPAGASGTAWAGVNATCWLTAHLALVAAGGSYPADYAQGLPGGRYLSLGIRIASRRPSQPAMSDHEAGVPVRTPGLHSGPRAPAPAGPAFEIRPLGERQRIRMRVPGAARVELMGDFTGWRAVPLTRLGDGRWELILPLGPGLYRMNVRVDGGPWAAPSGMPVVTDDFGGTVGILRVAGPGQ